MKRDDTDMAGKSASPPHCSAIMQIAVISVELCLTLITVECFCVLWNETVHLITKCILSFQKCFYLIKSKLPCFFFLRLLYAFIAGIL